MLVKKYYGQQGEDMILHAVIGNGPGFYVEVGAADGIFLSNTYVFDALGWKGICIEPNPDLFGKLKINRPNSINIRALAGEALSTSERFDKADNFAISKRLGDGQEASSRLILVPCVTLEFLFDVLGVTYVDVLSIDAEFWNMHVILGLNFSKVKPRVIVIENDDNFTKTKSILISNGYIHAKRHYFNDFFCLTDRDKQIILRTDPRMENGKRLDEKRVTPVRLSTEELSRKVIEFTKENGLDAPLSGDRILAEALVDIVYECGCIVETGTYLGYTAKWFQLFEKDYFGIEIDPDKVTNSLNTAPGANIIYGDSAQWLRDNHQALCGKPFLFLDAHWFDPWPLEQELMTLRKVSDPVIVIHDFDDKTGAGFDPGNNEEGPVKDFLAARPDLHPYILSKPHKIGALLVCKNVPDKEHWKPLIQHLEQ